MNRFKKIGQFAAFCLMLVVAEALQADPTSSPMIVFTKNADQKPYYSLWNGSGWSPSTGTAMGSVGSNPQWISLVNCPIRNEFSCLVQDAAKKVNFTVFNGSTWSSPTLVGANVGPNAQRAMCCAYENVSGNLLMVYWDTTLNQICYRTYNSSSISSQSTFTIPNNTHMKYMTLVSKPGSNEIMLLFVQNSPTLYAIPWNGSAWGTIVQLDSGLSWNDQEDYAMAYESLSGKGLLVYTKNSNYAPQYRTWDGTSWSSAADAPNFSSTCQWIRLAPDPSSNTILFGGMYTWHTDQTITVNSWNGSSWGTPYQVENNVPDSDIRHFDLAYESGTGKAIVVYQEGTATSVRYRTWNGSSWSAESTGTNLSDATRFVQVKTDPIGGKTLIAASDAGNDMETSTWNGSAMSATTQLTGNLNGASTTEQFMMAMPNERTAIPASIPYYCDFQSAVGTEWNTAITTTNAALTTFAGQHRTAPLKLSLYTTPGETYAVYFDFYALDSWNGSTGAGAPDYFSVTAGGTTLFNETFTNEYASTNGATYPYPYDSIGHYGFNASYKDGIYRKVQCKFTASATTTTLNFVATLTDETGLGYNDESWGIDNVSVRKADFIDVTASTGFNFSNTTSADTYGGGMCWADLDNDGDLDCIMSGNTGKLILNNSAGTSFSSASFPWTDFRYQTQLVDIDNDGDLDVWTPGLGNATSKGCATNNGSAVFTNAGNYGFTQPSTNEAAAIADVNKDGWPDVVMFSSSNYIGHHQGAGSVSLVGTNASKYGLNDSGDYGDGDYCSSGDVNNDGQTDFFYHFSGGKLFVSNGDGTFTSNNRGISVSTGASKKIGSAWADYDNDGDLDLFVCKYDESCTGTLWRNDRNWATGTGNFTDVTAAAGLNLNTVIDYTPDHPGTRSVCWGDYDNDGYLDLFVLGGNGTNYLYKNNGNGTFTRTCVGICPTGTFVDCCFVDYDNDGDLDLALTRENGTTLLYANRTNNTSYLKLRLIGNGEGGSNLPGIGTRVELWNATGTTLLARRDCGDARGFGGMDPLWLHFGGVSPTTVYMLKGYFNSNTPTMAIKPGSVSTTINGRTISQMTTMTEKGAVKVVKWFEVQNKSP